MAEDRGAVDRGSPVVLYDCSWSGPLRPWLWPKVSILAQLSPTESRPTVQNSLLAEPRAVSLPIRDTTYSSLFRFLLQLSTRWGGCQSVTVEVSQSMGPRSIGHVLSHQTLVFVQNGSAHRLELHLSAPLCRENVNLSPCSSNALTLSLTPWSLQRTTRQIQQSSVWVLKRTLYRRPPWQSTRVSKTTSAASAVNTSRHSGQTGCLWLEKEEFAGTKSRQIVKCQQVEH